MFLVDFGGSIWFEVEEEEEEEEGGLQGEYALVDEIIGVFLRRNGDDCACSGFAIVSSG